MTRQLALPFIHVPQWTAFLAVPSNAEARAWLNRAGDWPQRRLAIWGAAGSGKTHLLHRWAHAHGARLLNGADLTTEAALDPGSAPLAVDDADLAGARPLLHLLNAAAERGAPVVLASRTPPARWAVALPDLASRLRACLAVELRPAEDALLRGLLQALFADRQLPVAETVQEHLLRHLPRIPAALREAAARLDRLSLAVGGRITRPMAVLVAAELAEADGPATNDEVSAWPAAAGSQAGPGFL